MSPRAKNQLVIHRQELLKSKWDFSGRTLDRVHVSKEKANQSLFNGALIRKAGFESVDFSRSDFEGTRIEDTVFQSCNFTNCDFKSSVFSSCTFVDCSFPLALIEDCSFSKCVLRQCTFESAVVQESDFQSCSMQECRLRGSSWTLDSFYSSSFENTQLSDCTFLGHVFRGCKFKDVSFNAESIGTCYGITEQEIRSFRLIFLGQKVAPLSATELLQKFAEQKWTYERAVLRLNLKRNYLPDALADVLKATFLPLSNKLPLKKNQIRFFEKLLIELAERNTLPAIAPMRLITEVELLAKRFADAPRRATTRALQQLYFQLREIVASVMNTGLEAGVFQDLDRDTEVLARLTFERRPLTDIAGLLREVSVRIDTAENVKILSEGEGSYIAVVQTITSTLAGLRVIIWLTTGVVIQLNKLKLSTLELVGKRSASKSIKSTAQTGIPEMAQRRLALLVNEDLPLLLQNFLWKDHGANNLQSIAEVSKSRSRKAARLGSKRKSKVA